MKPYPLLFDPILKPKVWGGRALAGLGKRLPEGELVGESWELADLPDSIPGGRSNIANGEFGGMTLRQAIALHRSQIMGDAKLTAEGGFPLLIKFLDARQDLSVQVHPSPEYAATHPEAHLKSEAWVIVQARPGAVIYKDIKPGVTAKQLADHIRSGAVVNDLIAVPARAGDCHYLPSGTCHALGAGVLVAEIQTPSDTTFRVYDWGRSGPGRELHIDQALQCIHFGPPPHEPHKPHKPHRPIEVDGLRTTLLTATQYFSIERIDAIESARFRMVTSGQPEVWMMIRGRGTIHTPGLADVDLQPGFTVLMPADLDDSTVTMDRASWLLRITLPSALKGMIA